MGQTLVFETRNFALELHSLLKDLDPARWREEKKQHFKERIHKLEEELNRIYNTYSNELQSKIQKHKPSSSISERLHNMRDLLAELRDSHMEEIAPREKINNLRKRMETCYQELSLSMESYSIKLPKLRPTNYARSFFHVLSALVSLFIIEISPSPVYLIVLALLFSTSAWTMEILRRINDDAKEKIMNFFMPVAHPHEHVKVNSATWYSTALVILSLLSLLYSPVVAGIAVTVLGFADPSAATIGRKFGKIKLVGGRSLEGSSTFIIVGALVTFVYLFFLHPIISINQMIFVALFSGFFGAMGELFGSKLDDNLTIPISSAIGALIAFLLI